MCVLAVFVGDAEKDTKYGAVVRPVPKGARLAELLLSVGESVIIANRTSSSPSPDNHLEGTSP